MPTILMLSFCTGRLLRRRSAVASAQSVLPGGLWRISTSTNTRVSILLGGGAGGRLAGFLTATFLAAGFLTFVLRFFFSGMFPLLLLC